MVDFQAIIDKYYPHGTPGREIYMLHAQQVADKAIKTALECKLNINLEEVKVAAMLHDIGICFTNAPSIECQGIEPYIKHGVIGAEILRREGYPEIYARVAERHTGAGITIEDIDTQSLPLPRQNYCPETILERLVCYADKFFSKSGTMQEKSIESIRRSMERHSPATLERWLSLEKEFCVK